MAVIGITGGLASGKSTFCRALAAIKTAPGGFSIPIPPFARP